MASEDASYAAGVGAADMPAGGSAAGAGAGAGAGASSSSASSSSADVPDHIAYGTVMFAGSVAHSMTGRKDPPAAFDGIPETSLWNFHVLAPLKDVKVKAVYSGPTSCHYFAVDVAGRVYGWGRNERGQLGTGNTVNVYVPQLIAGLPGPIKSIACGKSHTLLLTESGDVLAAGDNKIGQCALGKGKVGDNPILKFSKVTGLPAGRCTSIGAGSDFSIAIADGKLYSAGSQQYGQCGTATDGVWIVAAGRTAVQEIPTFEAIPTAKVPAMAGVVYTDVKCGANHTLALTSDGRVFAWGWGAYGRCGNGTTADVLVPTPVKAFEQDRMRVRAIYAGASVSFAVCKVMNQIHYFGISKKTGEAAMTPKHIVEVTSLNPQAIAAGPTSTMMAFGGGNMGNVGQVPMLVAYGPSPTSGELGFGEAQKSSTKAKEVEDLAGTRVLDVAMGVGATVILVDTRASPAAAEGAGAGAAGGSAAAPAPVDRGSEGGAPAVPRTGAPNPPADYALRLMAEGKIKSYSPEQPDPSKAGKPKPAGTSLAGMGAHVNDGGAAGAGAGSKRGPGSPAPAGAPTAKKGKK